MCVFGQMTKSVNGTKSYQRRESHTPYEPSIPVDYEFIRLIYPNFFEPKV